jgi:hypothetical protein
MKQESTVTPGDGIYGYKKRFVLNNSGVEKQRG